MKHSPVFIIGCGRSGTTLLKDLLNSSSEIKFPPESHFLLEFYKLYGDPKTEQDALRIMSRLRKHYRFRRFHLDIKDEEIKDFRSYSAFIDYIYHKFADKYEAPRWGEKTPHYVKNVDDILKLFPHAKFIHIIRDGRDVALSLIAREWGPNNIYCAAKHWKSYVSAGLRANEKLGDSCLQMKYEDLLAHPKETMQKVAKFIGIEYTDDLLKLNSLKEDSYIANTKNFFGKNTSYRPSNRVLVSSNKNKWQDKVSKNDMLVFNTMAGDMLSDLGYKPSYDGQTIAIGKLKALWYKLSNFAMMVYKEFTSKDIYRRFLNRDTFPVIHSSRRILQKKHD